MFLFSLDYVWKLFKLDEKLSKTSTNTDTNQRVSIETSREYRDIIVRGRQREDQVASMLQKLSIPFERNVRASSGDQQRGYLFDIIIPNVNNLMYIIEIKSGLHIRFQLQNLLSLALRIRECYPNCKLILVLDKSNVRKNMLVSLEQEKKWDFVLDFSELEKLKGVVKLNN